MIIIFCFRLGIISYWEKKNEILYILLLPGKKIKYPAGFYWLKRKIIKTRQSEMKLKKYLLFMGSKPMKLNFKSIKSVINFILRMRKTRKISINKRSVLKLDSLIQIFSNFNIITKRRHFIRQL